MELARAFPDADISRCAVAASGITAIYFNHDSAMPLSPPDDWRNKQRGAAEMLIEIIRVG